jgi:hypothetical protein
MKLPITAPSLCSGFDAIATCMGLVPSSLVYTYATCLHGGSIREVAGRTARPVPRLLRRKQPQPAWYNVAQVGAQRPCLPNPRASNPSSNEPADTEMAVGTRLRLPDHGEGQRRFLRLCVGPARISCSQATAGHRDRYVCKRWCGAASTQEPTSSMSLMLSSSRS